MDSTLRCSAMKLSGGAGWSLPQCTKKAIVDDPTGSHCYVHSDGYKSEVKVKQDQRLQQWKDGTEQARIIYEGRNEAMDVLQAIVISLEDDHQRCPWCEDESWYGEGHTTACLLGQAKIALTKAQWRT